MNFLEKVALFVAPERMTKYKRAARFYEAAQVSSKSSGKHVFSTESADGALLGAAGSLRSWGRYLDENHDLATGALNALCREIVGKGIEIEPMVTSATGQSLTQVNDAISRLLEDWSPRVNAERDLSLNELSWLICRSWLRDGDVFTRHIESGYPFEQGRVPYVVQALESEMVPFSMFSRSPNVIMGVEKSVWGFPVAYRVLKDHPGASISALGLIGNGGGFLVEDNTERVPAFEIDHLKHVRRVQQTRGVTVFHSSIRRLEDLKEYEESEQLASRMTSDLVLAITKSPEVDVDPDVSEKTGERELRFQEGMILDNLTPGEDIKSLSHDRPNPELTNFRHAIGTAAAQGMGVKSSDLLGDYTRGNYSSQRQELVSHRPQIEYLQGVFIERHLKPVYARFIQAAARAGQIPIVRGMDIRTLSRAAYTAPQLIWIDPQKEIAAAATELQLNVESRIGLMRRRGRNPQVVNQQIADDKAFQDEFSTEAPPSAVATEQDEDAA